MYRWKNVLKYEKYMLRNVVNFYFDLLLIFYFDLLIITYHINCL